MTRNIQQEDGGINNSSYSNGIQTGENIGYTPIDAPQQPGYEAYDSNDGGKKGCSKYFKDLKWLLLIILGILALILIIYLLVGLLSSDDDDESSSRHSNTSYSETTTKKTKPTTEKKTEADDDDDDDDDDDFSLNGIIPDFDFGGGSSDNSGCKCSEDGCNCCKCHN